MSNKPVQLGLCCLNTLKSRKPPIFSQKMIIRKVEEDGIEKLKEKIIQNLKDLVMIDWNEENGIKFSDLVVNYSS